MGKWRVYRFVAVVILGTSALADARPKTDIVVIKNGDRVTCEIKELSRGKLQVSTDSMDKVYIEWADITSLQSTAYFHVTSSDGSFYFGSLEIPEGSDVLRVASDTTIVAVPKLSAVSITPIHKTFWSQNKGSAEIGFNYSKSTDLAEFYFDISNRYRTQRNIVDARINATVTDQGGEDGTKRRGGLGAAYYHIFGRSVTVSVGAKVERNDELNVKRRLLGRVAAGYNQIATNQNVLMLAAGLAINAERSYTEDRTNSSLEGVLHAGYSVFQYNLPEMAVDLVVDVYPSITEKGRYRVDLSLDARREIIDDLFIDFELYDNYDNKPPSGGEATSDYGIKTSLGYSWN
jgi:Holliday junction resolvase